MKNNWIQENVFMKSFTWDTFTPLGKLTMYVPLLFFMWFMLLFIIPIFGVLSLWEYLKLPKLPDYQLGRKWNKLFIKEPYL